MALLELKLKLSNRMADSTPPRIVRTVPPGAPGPVRPPRILIPPVDPRRLNFNNVPAPRPRQMNPGGSPGRRKGGRRTRRHKKKSRKTRRKHY
jgi:hypothetical protein